jgi:PRTRC genetic system protein E
MFKELAPYLRQRAVLLTVTHLEEDQIRVNVIPKKLKDGENAALTTPLTVTGTAEELDRELPVTIVGFVSAHLQLKNTLERAKSEMDEAAKTAAAEDKKKTAAGKKDTAKSEPAAKSDTVAKSAPAPKLEPQKPFSLFDQPLVQPDAPTAASADEESEILAETHEQDEEDEDEDLDEAA